MASGRANALRQDLAEDHANVAADQNLERKPSYSRADLIRDLRRSRAHELGLDATAAHVREKLMVFANADRETFVSVTTLAAAIGRSEKTVRRALGRLYEAGEVTPRIQVTPWGRRNVYKLAGRAVATKQTTDALLEREVAPSTPSLAAGQNDPMGTVRVTRSPPPETLLSDRDQKNVPPQPPLVVGPEVPTVAERVIARWRGARLPALDEHRARVVIGRRVADGVDVEELLDAVDGALARTSSEGWQGICSAFAVVMASADDVQAYARRGREVRSARERVQAAEREERARDSANQRVVISMRGALAKTIAAAAAGHYEVAARLAQDLELAPPDDRTKGAHSEPRRRI
jgi:hypothetical protein